MGNAPSFVSYDTTTLDEYGAFDQAYAWFNRDLFGGSLPGCLITLQRKNGARGYFSSERFHHRVAEAATDEIALNPDNFIGRTDKEILSTLVHEMVHLWQYRYGEPSRARYHNAEWAKKMEALGLMPSSTGEPGGKKTGQAMTHYILTGGLYDVSADALLSSGLRLRWQSKQMVGGSRAAKSKVKYTCPNCGQNAWAKPGANLLCGECIPEMARRMVRANVQTMTAED